MFEGLFSDFALLGNQWPQGKDSSMNNVLVVSYSSGRYNLSAAGTGPISQVVEPVLQKWRR